MQNPSEVIIQHNPYYQPITFFDDWILKQVIKHNTIFEEDICKYIVHYLQDNTDFVDIGANIGLISLGVDFLLKNTNKKLNTIHCFECSLRNLHVLQKNTRNNHNIRIYPFALSDQIQLVNINENPFNTGCDHISSIIYPTGSNHNFYYGEYSDRSIQNKSVYIPTLTLDNLQSFFLNTRVSVVKIDVEGFEWFVISGAKNWLQIHKPIIIIEIFSEHKEKVHNILYSFDYVCIQNIISDNLHSDNYIFSHISSLKEKDKEKE